jgi:hypothetical protein
MNNLSRFQVFSLVLIAAYLLAACSGTAPQAAPNVTAFRGVVEAMNGSEWTVGGQKVTLDPQALPDPNISVGDHVQVQAKLSPDGTVVALNVQASPKDKSVSSSALDDSSTPGASGSPTQAGGDKEVVGVVEAITDSTITVDGVTYPLADFTEFKGTLAVGNQVTVHVIVNADGTLTVREIETSSPTMDNSSNSNSGGSQDGPTHHAHDDKSNHNSGNDVPNHHSNEGNSGSGGHHGSGGG